MPYVCGGRSRGGSFGGRSFNRDLYTPRWWPNGEELYGNPPYELCLVSLAQPHSPQLYATGAALVLVAIVVLLLTPQSGGSKLVAQLLTTLPADTGTTDAHSDQCNQQRLTNHVTNRLLPLSKDFGIQHGTSWPTAMLKVLVFRAWPAHYICGELYLGHFTLAQCPVCLWPMYPPLLSNPNRLRLQHVTPVSIRSWYLGSLLWFT